ncbi:MAG: ABC transporter ATP-binding protein, partial [Bacteroidales bacterium]
ENIYLNGAILGMRKREINRKFDEIVDFSGCARYIDTPVKRYSSGMTVRLGFAVAAFLEPEILVVDEVLAVGDAEFQKKAIGKMQDVSRNEGRTVLFVSHNMAAVRKLCNKGILLENGQLFASGEVSDILSLYQTRSIEKIKSKKIIENEKLGNAEFRVLSIDAISPEGSVLSIESGVKIQLEFENNIENKNIAISIFIVTLEDLILFEAPIIFSSDNNSQKGKYLIEWDIQPFLLNSGTYKINLLVGESQKYIVYKKDDILTFEIENALFDQGLNLNRLPGVMRPKVDFKISSL